MAEGPTKADRLLRLVVAAEAGAEEEGTLKTEVRRGAETLVAARLRETITLAIRITALARLLVSFPL